MGRAEHKPTRVLDKTGRDVNTRVSKCFISARPALSCFLCHCSKDQLISKGLSAILNSSKKQTKQFNFTTITDYGHPMKAQIKEI